MVERGLLYQLHTKSMADINADASKFGHNQRLIKWLIGQEGELSYTQLLKSSGLCEHQLSRALRPMVAAKAVAHVWNEEGLAVYRLPESERENGHVS